MVQGLHLMSNPDILDTINLAILVEPDFDIKEMNLIEMLHFSGKSITVDIKDG